MQVLSWNQVITPGSSTNYRGRLGESGYNLKASAELVKVLNRIWSLEEQHASSVSSVKALRVELGHARSRIQELTQEQQACRHEMDDLMKQVAEDKLIRKNREQERIKAAVQSVKEELENEKKIRRRSESLHRKLGKELNEVKSAFSKALKDLERERKRRCLLEDLCDEFAKGIGNYEQEVRESKQNSAQDTDDRFDWLVLHISEAWLDERLQMKTAEEQGDLAGKNTIIERLSGEIESFLQTRRSNGSKNGTAYHTDGRKNGSLQRHSLESVHLNGTTSAPQDAEYDDSVTSDLLCFELNMNVNDSPIHDQIKLHGENETDKSEEKRKSNSTNENMKYSRKDKDHDLSGLQVQFVEGTCKTRLCNGNPVHVDDCLDEIRLPAHTDAESRCTEANQGKPATTRNSEICQAQDGDQNLKLKLDKQHEFDRLTGNLMKNQADFPRGTKFHPHRNIRKSCNHFSLQHHFAPVGGDDSSGDFCGISSPVQQWNHQPVFADLKMPEFSSKLLQMAQVNTLKAKLLEARLEGRHARLKSSKGSSNGIYN